MILVKILISIFVAFALIYLFTNRKTQIMREAPHISYTSPSLIDVPTSFDWRDHGLNIQIPDQGTCGSCWAWSAVMGLQARFEIAHQNIPSLSAQHILNCSKYCDSVLWPDSCDEGCTGGLVDHAWIFLRDKGTPDAQSVPFTGHTNECKELPTNTKLYFASTVYRVMPSVNLIKAEIAANGPVSAGMEAYSCFVNHNGQGIYKQQSGSTYIGPHAVLIVGWDDTEKAWIVANVWGTGWAQNGFGKVAWGECGIEQGIVTGKPLL